MVQGIAAVRTILLATICLLLASSPVFSEGPRCPPLPSANVLNEKEAAEVQKETEAAMRADFSAKAAIISKYLGISNPTHPAFHYVWCKIVIEDKNISIFAKFGLSVVVAREGMRRSLWPATTSGR